jgi:hypothetical protein
MLFRDTEKNWQNGCEGMLYCCQSVPKTPTVGVTNPALNTTIFDPENVVLKCT